MRTKRARAPPAFGSHRLHSPRRSARSGKLLGWLALVGSLAALNYASRFTEGKPPADTLYR